MKQSKGIYEYVNFEKLPGTKAWKLTSEYVRRQSKGICYTCGQKYPYEKLVAGHFREKRGNAGVYFDLDNLRCQCAWNCNRMGHGRKDIYAKKLREEIGEERFNNLFKKSIQDKKWTRYELDIIAEHTQKLIEKLSTPYPVAYGGK